MAELNVNIGNLPLKNPVMTASGTFGYGIEYADFMDISRLGGIFVKGTTIQPREGNDYPRMAESPSGMLNAVGLQNKGADYFAEHIYPEIKDINTNMIVNVSGSSVETYVECAEKIAELDRIPAIELNISCPNVKQGGMAFGVTTCGAGEVVKAVRRVYPKTLIVKLSPNVTDITEIAKAVEAEGADSVSLINTMLGMAIDAEKRKPILSTITGGLSGPCVKPVALRMVWQTYHAVKIPIIGLGGISNWKDAVEFMLAGASAIQIGTYNFVDPTVSIKVIDGLNDVNVSGSSVETYVECAEKIAELDRIPAIELNISCPNVKQGGMAFGVTTCGAGEVVKAVRRVYPKTLIVKLSPNVTDITEIAKAVEAEGADSVSLINTMLGMAIDAEKRKPILSTITGGLSGPCVKPVALRMVWQTYHAVKIPIIGLGGISNWKDAVEFMLAGASAIQIGTYNFVDPTVSIKVIDGLNDYCDRHGFKSVKELIGALDIQR